jgi:hypothetical protein
VSDTTKGKVVATSEKKDDSQSNETTPKQASVWVKREEWQLPDLGDDGWYPLSLLLDFYTPGDLATAIEKYGIYTNDRHGRTIHCTLKDNAEQYEQALDLLADWQSELDDPGHVYSWDSEKYEVEAHPTEYWWLKADVIEELKVLKATSETIQTSQATTSNQAIRSWKELIQDEAEKLCLEIEAKGGKPNFRALAGVLADWAKANGITTDGIHNPAADYIYAHVISASEWDAPIRKKYRNKRLS